MSSLVSDQRSRLIRSPLLERPTTVLVLARQIRHWAWPVSFMTMLTRVMTDRGRLIT
jgi:hypothetical protein